MTPAGAIYFKTRGLETRGLNAKIKGVAPARAGAGCRGQIAKIISTSKKAHYTGNGFEPDIMVRSTSCPTTTP